MLDLKRLQDKVLYTNQSNSFELIRDVYHFQTQNNPIFRQFLKLVGKLDCSIHQLEDLCFLPIELFKSNVVKSERWNEEMIFRSSGTTDPNRSSHYIENLEYYNKISRTCFELHFGSLEKYEIVALLPNYLERQDSSLVAMVRYFVNSANQHGLDVFFINDFKQLEKKLNTLNVLNKSVILFGVSFALLDFANLFKLNHPNLIVIETGGMKGQRREIAKTDLISQIQSGFPQSKIVSEYGMTELLSQAYALDGVNYSGPPFLKFLITDPTDPFSFLPCSKRGIVNVIDLANIHSCSFIQTGDLGQLNSKGELQVLGRYDLENLRGCSQLYED